MRSPALTRSRRAAPLGPRSAPIVAFLLGVLTVLPLGGLSAEVRSRLDQEETAAGESAQTDVAAGATTPDRYTVHLLSAAPGGAVWERFGHNGIWIRDHFSAEDIVWEWGIFNFDQVGFIGRLLKGTMLYSMGARYLDSMVAYYRTQGRDVWAQELALTPEQELELVRRINENWRPENREYTYNYYLDNCSTRVRDHLDAVLDGALSARLQGVGTGVSWRDHTLRLLRPSPPAWAGVQFVLGRPGDAEIDRWEELFLPLKLRQAVAEATVVGEDGVARPLVVREVPMVEGGRYPLMTEPPRWWPWALGLSIILVSNIAFMLLPARPPGSLGPRIAGLSMAGFGVVVGLAGTILAAAWLFTDHTFWRGNENLLYASPLTLLWIGPGLQLLRGKEVGRRGLRAVTVVGLLATLGLLLKLLPSGQETLSTALLLAPVQATAAIHLLHRALRFAENG